MASASAFERVTASAFNLDIAAGEVKSRSSSAPGPGMGPAGAVAGATGLAVSCTVTARMKPSAVSFSRISCSFLASMPDFLRRLAAVDLPSTARNTIPASRGNLEVLFLISSTPLGVLE